MQAYITLYITFSKSQGFIPILTYLLLVSILSVSCFRKGLVITKNAQEWTAVDGILIGLGLGALLGICIATTLVARADMVAESEERAAAKQTPDSTTSTSGE
jgi:hypothetical protein